MRGQAEGREPGIFGHLLKPAEAQHFTDTTRQMAAVEYQEPSKWTETGALES